MKEMRLEDHAPPEGFALLRTNPIELQWIVCPSGVSEIPRRSCKSISLLRYPWSARQARARFEHDGRPNGARDIKTELATLHAW